MNDTSVPRAAAVAQPFIINEADGTVLATLYGTLPVATGTKIEIAGNLPGPAGLDATVTGVRVRLGPAVSDLYLDVTVTPDAPRD